MFHKYVALNYILVKYLLSKGASYIMIFDNPRRAEFKLTNNYVFHAVYGSDTKKSRDALMALLNTILERKNDPIVSIKLLNPASVPWREDDKYIIMDIRAITNSGEIINIEMQNGNLSNYKERATYYGGVLLNNALETGEDYDMLKKCIVISIVNNGILFKENKRCYNIFDIRNTQDNFPMTDRLKWYFVELDKIDPEQSVDTLTPIEAVGAYFKYGSDPSKEDYIEKLLKSGEEAIKMSEPILREITEDEKEYHRMISEITGLSEDEIKKL